MELRRPTIADKETILEMLAEFEKAGSAMDGGFISKDVDFEEWIFRNKDYETGLNLPDGFVPSIQYVSFDQTGRALGFLSLRLRLNDFLLNKGGHIGYSIRPTERGKGLCQGPAATWFAGSRNQKYFQGPCDLLDRQSSQPLHDCGLWWRFGRCSRRSRKILD